MSQEIGHWLSLRCCSWPGTPWCLQFVLDICWTDCRYVSPSWVPRGTQQNWCLSCILRSEGREVHCEEMFSEGKQSSSSLSCYTQWLGYSDLELASSRIAEGGFSSTGLCVVCNEILQLEGEQRGQRSYLEIDWSVRRTRMKRTVSLASQVLLLSTVNILLNVWWIMRVIRAVEEISSSRGWGSQA